MRDLERRGGVLGGPIDGPARARAAYPVVAARRGATTRHRGTGFSGRVVRIGGGTVELEGATGLRRTFPLDPGGFAVDGRAVSLAPPRPAAPTASARTASGSRAVTVAAQVARASRIVVEGVHDAELLERVWGDDLRVEGVVVERLDGLDNLDAYRRAFRPGPGRRLGILVDHLVAGSKEQRVATSVRDPNVLVTGHPYVDVWAAIRPPVVGIERWPDVPRDRPWKDGVCAALGVEDPRGFWCSILGHVRDYRDLETPLVGAVEGLIDFVTAPDGR